MIPTTSLVHSVHSGRGVCVVACGIPGLLLATSTNNWLKCYFEACMAAVLELEVDDVDTRIRLTGLTSRLG